VIGLGEDPERAARTLVACTAAPLVTGLSVTGDALVASAPARLPDLFAGAPALVSLELRPEGGTLLVTGSTPDGALERRVRVPPASEGLGTAALAKLFAREAVEDLELQAAAKGDARAVDPAILRLGLELGVATRLTSWIAISEEPTVDPTKPIRRQAMPHLLPHGMSAEGLGLRGSTPRLLAESVRYCVAVDFEESMRAAAPPPPRAPGRSPTPTFSGGPPRKEHLERKVMPTPARPPLAGRVLVGADGLLVVEIELTEELDWTLPSHVVFSGEGWHRPGKALRSRSTAPGRHPAGTTVRLVFQNALLTEERVATLVQVRLFRQGRPPLDVRIDR
jgi:Ca-activated chloride channel family protein